ncbi:hypothetical protein NERG_02685 [Nematocida ausubeli]|uniref:Uncharacterized protein n=1 Tax=Nematocida ausubeli (strain ATCC PRA-371 / ERTm2) TaxID=1913371 RepID=H8ZGG4_NEMA1|nr:hypothetical protein NERG_02685 [Nematocida ausubeli]
MKALCKKSTLGKLLAISVVVSLVMAAIKYFSRRTHTAQDTLLKKTLCSAKEDAQARSLENIRKRGVERREWAMPVRETEDRRALDRQGNSNSTIQSSSGSQAVPILAKETEDKHILDRQESDSNTVSRSSGSPAVPILAKETEDNSTLDKQDRDSNTVSRNSVLSAVPILAKETEDKHILDRQDRDSDTVSGSSVLSSVPILAKETEDNSTLDRQESDSNTVSGSSVLSSVPMPDKRKNSLFIEEEKKKQNLAKYYVDIAEEELNREIACLEKLNKDIDKSWSIFIEVGKKLDSTRQRYIESMQTHRLIQEKESSIKEEICNYYRKEINTQIPTGIDLEYDEQIKRIGVMKEELDKMCSDQIRKWEAYKAYNKVAINGLKKGCDSREEKIKYFSILMLLEERLAIPMESTIEVNNKVYDEGKMLLSAREKEAEYFKKNNEGKESETLNEILEMHTKHIECLEKMNGLWIGMCNIQKDLLSEAREKYKAYVAYDIANSMYENEKKVFYKRKDELARAEEVLERHNSRIYSAASS